MRAFQSFPYRINTTPEFSCKFDLAAEPDLYRLRIFSLHIRKCDLAYLVGKFVFNISFNCLVGRFVITADTFGYFSYCAMPYLLCLE